MKRVVLLAIVFLFALQPWSMQLFYLFRQVHVKQYMRELLASESDFETLILTRMEYNLSKVDKNEVLVDNRMYDVKSVHFRDSMVVLKVLHDPKEEAVIKRIKEAAKANDRGESKRPAPLPVGYAIDFMAPSVSQILSSGKGIPISFFSITAHPNPGYYPVPVPPPWSC